MAQQVITKEEKKNVAEEAKEAKKDKKDNASAEEILNSERAKKIKDGLDAQNSFDSLKTTIFDELKKSEVKAEFALDLIFSIAPEEIAVPQYINEGLTWLENALCTEVN